MFGRRILVLIPHPDDEVVGCAAAIRRATGQGSQVFGAYLTTGVPAAEKLWPWQRNGHARRVARRRAEARHAAELLGIHPIFFQEIPSRQLKQSLASTRELLIHSIRTHGAVTLWAPAYEGGHQDHDVANFLASTLRDLAEVWEFGEYNYFGGRAYSNQFISRRGMECEIVLESAERQHKQEALGIYRSERDNLRHVRAEREVFRPMADYDYSRPPQSGKLFYQRFQWVPYHPRVDYCQPEEVCRAILEFAAREPGASSFRGRVRGA
jgi:LmbE family N-acetylglucosaminyl deacetylase